MARTHKKTDQTIPATVLTQDIDAKRTVDVFKNTKGYQTHSEALEKLIGRAERLNLHRMGDEEFDALIEGLVVGSK